MSLFGVALYEVKPSDIPDKDERCLVCRADYQDMRNETDAKIIRHSRRIGESKFLHKECLKSWYEEGSGEFKRCVVCQGHDLTETDFETLGISGQVALTERRIDIINHEVIPALEQDYDNERAVLQTLLEEFEEVKRTSLLYGLLTKNYYLENRIKESKSRLSSIRSEIQSWESSIKRMKEYRSISIKSLVKQVACSAAVSAVSAACFVFSFGYLSEYYPNPKENHYDTLDYRAAGFGMLGSLSTAIAGIGCAYEPTVELTSRLWTWKNH